MGKEWENRQLEKLKTLQEKRILELEKVAEVEVTKHLDAEKKNLETEEEL